MRPDEYRTLSATRLGTLVATGEVSADEVHAAATAVHEATHPRINAVVEWYDDPLPAARGGPLAGVPFLRKDYGSTEAGRLVEMGSRLTQGVVATTTSRFYRLVRSSGARVVGRSAVPEMIMHGTTESRATGTTRNPYDPAWSAGGSSGGAGAAVAAGVVPVAHASDCAGSIRIPAAVCGVLGLKPGRGRIPWEEGAWGGIATEFVLSRTVGDAATFLDLLSSPSFEASLEPAPPAPRRIAVDTSHWAGAAVDPHVVAATETAARQLAEAGHVVEAIERPVDAEAIESGWDALFGRWVAHDVDVWSARTGRPVDGDHLEPATLAQIEAVRRLTVDDITAAQERTGRAVFDFVERMEPFDALLTPTLGRARIPLAKVSGELDDLDEYLRTNVEIFCYSFLANVSGWPAVSVPAGVVGGHPVGVQLMAPPGSERRLLHLAADLGVPQE
ncbi:MAG: amidase [Actinomycetota bacterium]